MDRRHRRGGRRTAQCLPIRLPRGFAVASGTRLRRKKSTKGEDVMDKIVLEIDGMVCGMCEAHVNATVRLAVPSARRVKSSRKTGKTEFFSGDPVDFSALEAALRSTGYALLSHEVLLEKEKSFFWKRLKK